MEREEVLELITKAQHGDNESCELLLTRNSPLIKSVIRRYKNKGVEYDDLYQLGCVGFVKAVKNFSTAYDVRFSTYAVPMIAGEVKRFLRDDGPIKVSRGTKAAAIKIAKFVDEYKSKHDCSPTLDTISKQFGIEPQEAVFIMDSNKYPVSLYEKSDDDSSRTVIDKIQSDENEDDKLDKMMLKNIISTLSSRDKRIILLRYFADKTQSEVARVMGVSQVQISRLECKILCRIREQYSEPV